MESASAYLSWGSETNACTAYYARISQFVKMNKLVDKISIQILQILCSLHLCANDSTEFAYAVCLSLNNSSRFRRFCLPTTTTYRQILHHARYAEHKLLNCYRRWVIKLRSLNIISFLRSRCFNDVQQMIREHRNREKKKWLRPLKSIYRMPNRSLFSSNCYCVVWNALPKQKQQQNLSQSRWYGD